MSRQQMWLAADTDAHRIADLFDTFQWANAHGCHDGMACQCTAPTPFIHELPSSPPLDPTLDLHLPVALAQCNC
jgi:hypothetical protein